MYFFVKESPPSAATDFTGDERAILRIEII
jgi:hypothetical protein